MTANIAFPGLRSQPATPNAGHIFGKIFVRDCNEGNCTICKTYIRPQAVRPLENLERWPSPGGFLVFGRWP